MKKMKRIRKYFAIAVAISLCAGGQWIPQTGPKAEAKGAMKLSKTSLTMKNSDFKEIKVKNPTQKVKWAISTKKYGYIDSYGTKKATCGVYTSGKGSAGSFTVTAKVGKKKFKCKVKVKAASQSTEEKSTTKPAATATPVRTTSVPTATTQAPASATQAPGTTTQAPGATTQAPRTTSQASTTTTAPRATTQAPTPTPTPEPGVHINIVNTFPLALSSGSSSDFQNFTLTECRYDSSLIYDAYKVYIYIRF